MTPRSGLTSGSMEHIAGAARSRSATAGIPEPCPKWVRQYPRSTHPDLIEAFARGWRAAGLAAYNDCLRAASRAEPQYRMQNSARAALANAHGADPRRSGTVRGGPVLLVDDLVDSAGR